MHNDGPPWIGVTAITLTILVVLVNEISESMTTAVESGAFQRASEQITTQAIAPLGLLSLTVYAVITVGGLSVLYRLVQPALKNSSGVENE